MVDENMKTFHRHSFARRYFYTRVIVPIPSLLLRTLIFHSYHSTSILFQNDMFKLPSSLFVVAGSSTAMLLKAHFWLDGYQFINILSFFSFS